MRSHPCSHPHPLPIRVARLALFSIAAGLVASCGSDSSPSPVQPDPAPVVATVVVNLPAGPILPGEVITASAVALTSGGETLDAIFTWTSTNTRVAVVSPSGVVTGRSMGPVTISATTGSVTGVAALDVDPRDLSGLVEEIRLERGLPAMAGAIVTRDGVQGFGASGVRRSPDGPSVTLNDRWHIGSNLKAITAALAAIAVGEGRIQWSTTIEAMFPEFAPTMRNEYRSITLDDLLSNRGRIRNDPPGGTYAGATARQQREAMVSWAVHAEPVGPQGGYHYSNPGFVTAGAMIERALEGTYEDLVRSKIGDPLGVTGLGWGPTTTAGSNDQPKGHRLQGGSWVVCEACDNPPGLSAAGRAHMRIEDWARIAVEFLRADAGESELIGPVDGRKLFTEHVSMGSGTNEYALGWIMTTRSWAGGRAATHSGSNTSNRSVAWLGLGNGVGFLVTTNGWDAAGGITSPATDALISRLLNYYQTGN